MENENLFKKFSSNIINLVMIVLFVYLTILISNLIWENYQINKKINNLSTNLEILALENQMEKEMLNYYQSDTYQEIELRKRLMLKKKGEKVVLLPIHKNTQNDTWQKYYFEIKQNSRISKPNYYKWWQLFFGKANPFQS